MELIMYSSIISAIVLCVIGIIKLPLKPFKGKPFYKPGLTLLTIFFTIGLCVLCELYIIHESVLSVGMLYLLLITFGEVMLTYNGVYEGFGLKQILQDFFKKIGKKIGKLLIKSPEIKLTKSAEKYGLDEAIVYLQDLAKIKAEQEAIKAQAEAEENKPMEVNWWV